MKRRVTGPEDAIRELQVPAKAGRDLFAAQGPVQGRDQAQVAQGRIPLEDHDRVPTRIVDLEVMRENTADHLQELTADLDLGPDRDPTLEAAVAAGPTIADTTANANSDLTTIAVPTTSPDFRDSAIRIIAAVETSKIVIVSTTTISTTIALIIVIIGEIITIIDSRTGAGAIAGVVDFFIIINPVSGTLETDGISGIAGARGTGTAIEVIHRIL